MKINIRAATVALVAGIATALAVLPAQATTTWGVPVVTTCSTGWYVNPDEAALLPKQTPEGFLFDGPSLVHREVSPVLELKDVTAGTFVADVKTGVAPLFKMETANPYMTINVTPAGTFWSSKIDAADPGGQSSPVATAADLLGKTMKTGAPVPETVRVTTFGVGYGNDAGNKAVVSRITFKGTAHDLTCPPVQTTSPTPTASASTSTSPSASTSVSPSASVSAGTSTSPSASASSTVSPSVSVSPSASSTVSPSVSASAIPDVTCADFVSQAEAQEAFDADRDGLAGLDGDGDGLACESVTAPGTPDGPSSGLPLTGPSGGILAGLALIAIGSGVALIVLARRRKVGAVA